MMLYLDVRTLFPIILLVFFQSLSEAKIRTPKDTSQIDNWLDKSWDLSSFNQDSGCLYADFAYAASLHIKDSMRLTKALRYKSINLRKKGKYVEALHHLLKASKIDERLGNRKKLAADYMGIGSVYYEQENYDKAEEYWTNALDIYDLEQQLHHQSVLLANLGALRNVQLKPLEALAYYKKCLEIDTKINDPSNLGDTHLNLAEIYQNLDKPAYKDTALVHYEKAIKLYNEVSQKSGVGSCYLGMGQLQIEKGNLAKAEQLLLDALTIFTKLGNKKHLEQCYSYLTGFYKNKKDFKKAFEFQERFKAVHDSLHSNEIQNEIADLEIKYHTAEQEKHIKIQELELDQRKAEIRQKNIIGAGLVLSLVLIAGLAIVIGMRNREKNKANKIITEQKEIVERQNQKVSDSINYAKSIQSATLPSDQEIAQVFEDYFIFYKPKDIVSGDFYWLHQTNKESFFALADCTGHGVPGAFMSMLGNSLLNEIVTTHEVHEPNKILCHLKDKMMSAMKQEGDGYHQYDGMDISLIKKNNENFDQVEFAGAFNPLYVVTQNVKHFLDNNTLRKEDYIITEINKHPGRTLIEIKANAQPVGKYFKDEKPFDLKTVPLQKNDCLYLFTDGYVDQMGGVGDIKFMIEPFKELLTSMHHHNMQDQHEILSNTIKNWIAHGKRDQMDDMTIIGIRV